MAHVPMWKGNRVNDTEAYDLQTRFPYGIPTETEKTVRTTRRMALPDGRVLEETEETTTRGRGLQQAPTLQNLDESAGKGHGCLAGMSAFLITAVVCSFGPSSTFDKPWLALVYWGLFAFLWWRLSEWTR